MRSKAAEREAMTTTTRQIHFNLAVLRALKDQYNAIATLQALARANGTEKSETLADMTAMTSSLEKVMDALEAQVNEQQRT